MYRIKLRLLCLAVALGLSIASAPLFSNPALASGKKEEVVIDPNKKAYVQLSPIIVPIMTEEGITQIVTLVVALEVDSALNEPMVLDNRLRLTDAFLTDMYGVFDKNVLIKNGFVDVERIKYRLGKISNKVLGKEVVTGVLLQAVQQRKV